jgi:MerR family transcriptional regulator, heat shock protein HspR
MSDQEEGVYIISVAARLADVHPQTLRMYERKGLLTPARTAKNRRSYSEADVKRLRRIQRLTQKEGLNLSGVRMVLDMEDEMSDLRERIDSLEKEILDARRRFRQEIDQFKRQKALTRKSPTGLVLKGRVRRPRGY